MKATFELDTDAAGDDGASSSNPTLGAGRIKLGNHASILIFEIEDMPAVADALTLRLPYMADNAGQQNVLRLVDGDRSRRHVLGADNEFTVIGTDFFGVDSSSRQEPTSGTRELTSWPLAAPDADQLGSHQSDR